MRVDEIKETAQNEAKWQSGRLDWATLLHRVYDIDALRCECGGDIRFEELVQDPKKAKAFLSLHKIESPRATNAEHHIKPWSDAPNIALLSSLHPGATAQQEGTSQEPDGMPPMSASFQNDRDHRDEIPPADSYFLDEVPPD
jgi:hypothetical protein